MSEALEQVDQYAALHPARWKQHIRNHWQAGKPVEGFPLIYGLRNHPHYGPQWLARYTPKKQAKATRND